MTLALVLAPAESPAQSPIGIGSALVALDDSDEEEEEQEKLIGLLDRTLAKPLMTVAEEKAFEARKLREYTTSALKSLSPTNAQKDLIDEAVRYRVRRMTMHENWTGMANVTRDVIKDLEIFAASDRAREQALIAYVRELDSLVNSDQPKFVKINATLLLGRLNIEDVDIRNNTPAVPYFPAAEPLVKTLTDSQHGMDIKIPAIRGLSRIMTDGDPPRELRDKIAKALTDELNRIENYVVGPGRDWYQWVLIDALGCVEFPRSMTRQTHVVDVLWKTMHDESLPWHLRTRAVRSLGQIKLDSTFNVHLLVHEIVLLTGQMTFTYNTNPNLSFWPQCFSDVYFAFRPEDSRQQERGWGLLQNPPAGAKQVVEGAYQQVLPLINAVLKNEKPDKVPGHLLTPTSEWLKDNRPADAKIHQNAQPLIVDEPQPAEATDPSGADTGNVVRPEVDAVAAGE